MQLAELLKQRRRRIGLSANDVADRAEVGRSYYFEIEQGKRTNISLQIAARLSQVLKVSLNDLAAAASQVALRTPKGAKQKPTRRRTSVAMDPLAKLRSDFDVLVAKMQTPRAIAAGKALFAASGKDLGAMAHANAKTADSTIRKNRSAETTSHSRRRSVRVPKSTG